MSIVLSWLRPSLRACCLLFVSTLSCADELQIVAGEVPLSPPGAPAAAYFTLKNSGAEKILVDVESPAAGMSMLHETRIVDGVSRMRHVDALTIPAGGELVLAPGGVHVMLMQLKKPLTAGEQLALDLLFKDGTRQRIELPVRAR